MKTRKLFNLISCLMLLTGIFMLQFLPSAIALAADEEKVDLSTKFPSFSGNANVDYTFDINVQYMGGKEPRVFNLAVSGPPEFFYAIQQSYGTTTDITSIKLDPSSSYPEVVKVKATPNILRPPDPGKYTITLDISSDTIKGSLDLTIQINARYSIQLTTPGGVLSTQITADKTNSMTLEVTNNGPSPLENITLSQYIKGSPSGWEIKFDPEKIDNLAPNNTKEVKMDIKPSAKTISGDYEIVVSAKPEAVNASSDLTLRVTVLTQTIWGWVGVGIIVIVVVGLIAMFMFLGRR